MNSNLFTEFNNLYFLNLYYFVNSLIRKVMLYQLDSSIMRPCVDYDSFWHTRTIIDRSVYSCKNVQRT